MHVVEVFIIRKTYKRYENTFHIFQSLTGLESLLDRFWPPSLLFDIPDIAHLSDFSSKYYSNPP